MEGGGGAPLVRETDHAGYPISCSPRDSEGRTVGAAGKAIATW